MKYVPYLSGLALLATAGGASAIVIDGTRDADYLLPAAGSTVQTVQTQFGDNGDPAGFGGGGELNGGYAIADINTYPAVNYLARASFHFSPGHHGGGGEHADGGHTDGDHGGGDAHGAEKHDEPAHDAHGAH